MKSIYKLCEIFKKGINKIIIVPSIKASLKSCGKNVRIAYDVDFKSPCNICIGDNSQIGPRALFWTTRAKIIIGNNVLFGPNVTIITGDHRTDIIGKHISEVKDDEKLPENDGDVIIENGAWIGSNVTILKGVVIGEGSVIGAGSVVTKNTEPYSIYIGMPAHKIKQRFTDEQLEEHKALLNSTFAV